MGALLPFFHMQGCHKDFFRYEIRRLAVAAMSSNLNYTSKGQINSTDQSY